MDLSWIKTFAVIHIMMFISFLFSGLVLNVCQLITTILVWPFSKYWYRTINYYLCYAFYSQYILLTEWWANLEIEVFADEKDVEYFGREHVLFVSNHSYEIDWLMAFSYANKFKAMGFAKAFAKKSVQYVPIFGWIWYFAEYPLLTRSFEKDKHLIAKHAADMARYPSPNFVLLFPEGTRWTPAKYKESVKYAEEKGLPFLKHHLTPRSKGFALSVQPMSKNIGAVYDTIMSIDSELKIKPSFYNILMGKKIKSVWYMRRIPFNEIPKDDKKVVDFLHELFIRKDKLQDSFYKTGDHFAESGVKRVTNKIKITGSSFIPLTISIIWYLMIWIPIFYYLSLSVINGQYIPLITMIAVMVVFRVLLKLLLTTTETR